MMRSNSSGDLLGSGVAQFALAVCVLLAVQLLVPFGLASAGLWALRAGCRRLRWIRLTLAPTSGPPDWQHPSVHLSAPHRGPRVDWRGFARESGRVTHGPAVASRTLPYRIIRASADRTHHEVTVVLENQRRPGIPVSLRRPHGVTTRRVENEIPIVLHGGGWDGAPHQDSVDRS